MIWFLVDFQGQTHILLFYGFGPRDLLPSVSFGSLYIFRYKRLKLLLGWPSYSVHIFIVLNQFGSVACAVWAVCYPGLVLQLACTSTWFSLHTRILTGSQLKCQISINHEYDVVSYIQQARVGQVCGYQKLCCLWSQEVLHFYCA
jgi:hypothetical protein